MTKKKIKTERDLGKIYSKKDFVAKLRRLADSMDQKPVKAPGQLL